MGKRYFLGKAVAVVESYRMAARQIRYMATVMPPTWEMIFVDDGSSPEIPIPEERPALFTLIRTGQVRAAGEWTQHLAINAGAHIAEGEYIVKSDIDHVFTPGAIAAADQFCGDLMLFHRIAGTLADDFRIHPLPDRITSPIDDIYVVKRSIFERIGGYPPRAQRKYGDGGSFLHEYSRKPEAQPPEGATIVVVPDTHEQYHGLARYS